MCYGNLLKDLIKQKQKTTAFNINYKRWFYEIIRVNICYTLIRD